MTSDIFILNKHNCNFIIERQKNLYVKMSESVTAFVSAVILTDLSLILWNYNNSYLIYFLSSTMCKFVVRKVCICHNAFYCG